MKATYSEWQKFEILVLKTPHFLFIKHHKNIIQVGAEICMHWVALSVLFKAACIEISIVFLIKGLFDLTID